MTRPIALNSTELNLTPSIISRTIFCPLPSLYTVYDNLLTVFSEVKTPCYDSGKGDDLRGKRNER